MRIESSVTRVFNRLATLHSVEVLAMRFPAGRSRTEKACHRAAKDAYWTACNLLAEAMDDAGIPIPPHELEADNVEPIL